MSPLLVLTLALVAGAYCGPTNPAPATSALDIPFTEDELSAMFFCAIYGFDFNGYKLCQVGCRAACLQPGCGGFDKCEMQPNRLHKYKCFCKKR